MNQFNMHRTLRTFTQVFVSVYKSVFPQHVSVILSMIHMQATPALARGSGLTVRSLATGRRLSGLLITLILLLQDVVSFKLMMG